MSITIRKAKSNDLPRVIELMSVVSLPSDGLTEHISTFIVAEEEGQLRGCAGLEIYGDVGLLRSVAVHPDDQHRGLGSRLMERILTEAKSHRLKSLYLLTTSAGPFMAKFGFESITRERADPCVQQSAEFKSTCCESAVCMKRSL